MNEPRPPMQGHPQHAGTQRPLGAAPAAPQVRPPQIGLQPKPAKAVRAQPAGDEPIELAEEFGESTTRPAASDAAPVSKIRFGPELTQEA